MNSKAKSLEEFRLVITNLTKDTSSFVIIGQILDRIYHQDKLIATQKEFLEWTKRNLGFSKSTTYEYIISHRVYSDINDNLPSGYRPPIYQSHCQLLAKIQKPDLKTTWISICDDAPATGITTAFVENWLDQHQLRAPGRSRVSQGSTASASASTSKTTKSPRPTRVSRVVNRKSKKVVHSSDEAESSSGSSSDEDLSGVSSDESEVSRKIPHSRGPRMSFKSISKSNVPSPRLFEGPSVVNNLKDSNTPLGSPSDDKSSMTTFPTPPSTIFMGPHSRSLSAHLLQSPGSSAGAAARVAAYIEKTPPKKRTKVMTQIGHLIEELNDCQETNILSSTSSLEPSPLTNAPVVAYSPQGVHPFVPVPEKETSDKWFNENLIFHLAQSVVFGQQFDLIAQTQPEFKLICNDQWYGRIWCNLSGFKAGSTGSFSNQGQTSLENALQVVFTKFATKEFTEGFFVLPAEFGADWLTPILQYPYCILRHIPPPGHLDGETAFESYLVFYLGSNVKDFCTNFRSVGLVPGINSW